MAKSFIIIRIIQTIIIGVCITSCSEYMNDIPANYVSDKDGKDVLRISRWQLVGPFVADSVLNSKYRTDPRPAMDYDYLSDFGITEATIKSTLLDKISKDRSTHPQFIHQKFINKLVVDTSFIFNFLKYFQKADNSVVYTFCEVKCDVDQEVVITTSSDDGIRVWCNGEMIIDKPDFRGFNTNLDVDYNIIKLKKGINNLLLKVHNSYFGWGMQCTIYGGKSANKAIQAPGLVKFMKSLVFEKHRSDTIIIDNQLTNRFKEFDVVIKDISDKIIYKKHLSDLNISKIPIEQLKTGLYNIEIKNKLISSTQWVFSGNDLEDYCSFLSSQFNLIINQRARINAEALFFRLNHLLSKENKRLGDLEWEEKFIDVLHEMESILNDSRFNINPVKNKKGLYIRGYRSIIDNQNQYYLVYVPNSYDSLKATPIVIVIPSVTEPNRHFLKSYLLANLKQLQGNFREAEKHGYILVWPGSRLYSDGMPIAETEIKEVLKEISSDYYLEKNQTYLLGACSGGLDALTLGKRYPDRYAAIGIYSPFTSRGAGLNSNLNIPNSFTTNWSKENSPIESIENFYNLPLYALHAQDNHAPFTQTTKLIEQCSKKSVNLYSQIIPTELGSDQYGISYTNYNVFDFFNHKSINKTPKIIQYKTSDIKHNKAYWVTINRRINPKEPCSIKAEVIDSTAIEINSTNVAEVTLCIRGLGLTSSALTIMNNGKNQPINKLHPDTIQIKIVTDTSKSEFRKNSLIAGPIAHAFSGPFMLVDHILTKNENISPICDTIITKWKRDFFVDSLRYKSVNRLTDSDIDNYNLILVGDTTNNPFIKKVFQKLPLKSSPSRIQLSQKVFNGKNIGIIMVYPNPLNPKRYIVLITSNNWSKFKLPSLNLALEGFYDYIVIKTYSNGRIDTDVLSVGTFDDNWLSINPF